VKLYLDVCKFDITERVASIPPAFIFPKFLVAIVAVIKSQSPLGANVASYKKSIVPVSSRWQHRTASVWN